MRASENDSGETAFVALGSNVGDRLANLRRAAEALSALKNTTLVRLSSIYETAPVGGPPDQSDYYNAAVELRTTLAPRDLLDYCLAIEGGMGRQRTVRNGPRVIDLDLLLFGDVCVAGESLSVPHPRLHERRFVLAPLAEIAGATVHPRLGVTIAALLDRLGSDDGSIRCSTGKDWADS